MPLVTGMKWFMLALIITLSGAVSSGSQPPASVTVAPRVGSAPALIRVRVKVPPADANRDLIVEVDGPDYYSSSAVPLEGRDAPTLHVLSFKSVPPGPYLIQTTLVREGQPDWSANTEVKVLGMDGEPGE